MIHIPCYKGVTYYYLTNYRGDVLAMTDESGNVVASYSYDAWGNILSQSGEMAT
ncbi:MAG TPA: RHS domain-containing protein, partial [Ureibacillus sp.]|nr:RHS domain-containing protein [Ureibacillus sp.]